jgi:transcriptional regulator with PAS, ATPase and Fis domain
VSPPRIDRRQPADARIRALIRRIAPLPGTVLVQGDTGTGKELVARWLHASSARRGAFVALNCGAIAPSCWKASCSATPRARSRARTRGGKACSWPPRRHALPRRDQRDALSLQVKLLLRVLEEGAIRPVGADQESPVDVRGSSLRRSIRSWTLVRERRFREDLYFRLNVARINLPPLRERCEDLPLAAHFMELLAETWAWSRLRST